MNSQRPTAGFSKSLADQIDEIDRLLYDAQERLDQARYALETLQDRLASAAADSSDD